MIRVALLSFWHVHARDYAKQAVHHPEVEIVAVWDEDPERGKQHAEQFGVDYYSDLSSLLASDQIDGVIVCTPTIDHHEVMLAAARAGKHIFTEKVLTITTQQGIEVLKAVTEAGIKLTVSLPRLYTGFTQAIRQVIDEGWLGDLTLVRTRLSHHGAVPSAEHPNGYLPESFFQLASTGGGSMIDLGCHPMILARLFLGMPDSVLASYGYVTGREVEDNAVVVLRYQQGAMAVVEAGFVNRSPLQIDVYGMRGSLTFNSLTGKVLVASEKFEAPGIREWPVPENLPSPFEQWVSHIVNGTEVTENLALALDLTRLMEAANTSAKTETVFNLTELP